jgi:hypothetical protein
VNAINLKSREEKKLEGKIGITDTVPKFIITSKIDLED